MIEPPEIIDHGLPRNFGLYECEEICFRNLLGEEQVAELATPMKALALNNPPKLRNWAPSR